MQLLLMLKLNIKHTYTVIEGLHKTSHQMADLVCIIDMLMYLVFCFYIYIYIYFPILETQTQLLMVRHMKCYALSTAVQVQEHDQAVTDTVLVVHHVLTN